MSGWERKKARHGTGMYLDEKLSHRIFLLTTAPRHTLQAPLPGPFETKLPPAILRHLPMTRAARAHARGACSWFGVPAVAAGGLRCDAGGDVFRTAPRSILCQGANFFDDDTRVPHGWYKKVAILRSTC